MTLCASLLFRSAAIVVSGLALVACRSPSPPGIATSDAGAAHPEEISDPILRSPPPPSNAGAPSAAPSVAGTETSSPTHTDWCLDGLSVLDDEDCYVLPPPQDRGDAAASTSSAPPLLVYLHGLVPPVPDSPQKEQVQYAVLRAAPRAGAAALLPRGMRGVGPGFARDGWAWPTDPATHTKYVGRLVAKWAEAKRRLEQLAGVAFPRTFLAGSSNGAYFVTALALNGDCDRLGFPIDGYAALSGGATGGRSVSAVAPSPRPFYIGYGAYDAATKSSALALAALLSAMKWPTRTSEHPVGHGAREEYLDEAFAFWAEHAPPAP